MSQVNVKNLPEEIRNRLRSDTQINSVTQCVTELVFNSLDAKSTAIAVRLNLATHRIQVIDNGEGITLSNMENVGVRYMTSKCHSLDIFERKHKTYGYKGESLASIIAISKKIEITSRHEKDETYLKVFFNGSEQPIILSKNRPSKGTTITIEDFLYNCPVRQNRIKKVDISYVKKILEHLTLIFPNVAFSLRNDETGDVILNSRKEKTVSHTLCALNATLDIKKFSEIKVVKGNIRISGLFYMTSTSITNMQFFYVNKFPVHFHNLQKLIKKSLYQRMDDIFLSESAYPVYVVNIQCPYSEVDISFDSSRYVAKFKSLYTIERCVGKIIKMYVKKYNKQCERNAETSNKTIELEDENMFESDVEKKETVKPRRKTLGIRYDLSDAKFLQNDNKNSINSDKSKRNQNKIKKTLGIRFHQPKQVVEKVFEKNSPKSLTSKTTSNFVCLANAVNNDWVPNKLLGIFDENYESQNFTLPKLSSQHLDNVQHNEEEGKKVIMEAFIRSLPTSQEFCEDEKNKTVSNNNDPYSYDTIKNNSSEQTNDRTIEDNPAKDISLCIKQQDNTAKKRRLENLNSVGTHLIEKKIKLQNAVDANENLENAIKRQDELPLIGDGNLVQSAPNKCNVNLQVLLKQLLEQNIICDGTNQAGDNVKKFTTTATSPLISHRTVACQTKASSLYKKSKVLETDKKVNTGHNKIVKYNIEATSPFDFGEQNKKDKLRDKEIGTISFTRPISSLKYTEINFLDNSWEQKDINNDCNINKHEKQEKEEMAWKRHNKEKDKIGSKSKCSQEKSSFKEENQNRKKVESKTTDNFMFRFSPGECSIFKDTNLPDTDLTFNSHYFQSPATKITATKSVKQYDVIRKKADIRKKNSTVVEVNTEKLLHDLTLQSLFVQNLEIPQKCCPKMNTILSSPFFKKPNVKNKQKKQIENPSCDGNNSDYFNAPVDNFKEMTTKKPFNKRKSIILDTSTFNFQTPTKDDIKKPAFPALPDNEPSISDSVATFGLFNPEHKSTQKEEGGSGKFNFFESIFFDDEKKTASTCFENKQNHQKKIHGGKNGNANFFKFDQQNPEEENLFSMKKRIDFLPKGLSPILKETKVLDITLSPTSKRNLNNAIVKSFEDELHFVKWMEYMDKENPKEFFDKMYTEKQKMMGKNIPSIQTGFRSLQRNAGDQPATFNKEIFATVEIIGQLDNKFIVAMSKSKLLLFDQHAVHERIRLESLYSEYIIRNKTGNQKFKSTPYGKYIKITFSDVDLHFLKTYNDLFEDIGFEYEVHKSYVLITKIPQCLYKRNMQDQTDEYFYNFVESLIKEEINVLQETRGVRSSIPRLLQHAMSAEACRGAIKFGRQLSNADCVMYIKMLSKCQLPFQCAHGRPTIYPVLTLSPPADTAMKINLSKLLISDL